MAVTEHMKAGIFLFLTVVVVIDKVSGHDALLKIKSTDPTVTTAEHAICVTYNSDYQKLPTAVDDADLHPLVNMSKVEGCSEEDFINPRAPIDNATVAVSRGNCTYIHKALMVQSFNGSAVLVVDHKNATQRVSPGGNKTEFDSVDIPIVIVPYRDYQSLLKLPGSLSIGIYAPPLSPFDGNMILIVVLSTAFVMIAGGWAAYQESGTLKGSRRTPSELRDKAGDDEENKSGTKKEGEEITLLSVLIWFVLICGMILLLYFFYKYLVYFFIAVFCIFSSYSLYQCLLPAWSRLLPIMYDIPINRLPCFSTKIKLRSFLLLMPCLTLGIFWAVERHSQYAWTLQDILGTAFCVFFIQSIRLPNLKILAMLLVLLLLYDVFFVFITPLFTKDGKSVMETVATGGRDGSNEMLPLVFLVPILGSSPLLACRDRQFSLLGFGDVIIPGLLIAYNAVFDVKTGSRMVYYLVSSGGYLIGMIVCMISLFLMNTGQPALLYLVPATLLSTLAVALLRGEFKSLFFGLHWKKIKDHDIMEDVEATAPAADDDDANNSANEEERRNLIS